MMQKSSKVYNTPRNVLQGIENAALAAFFVGIIFGLWLLYLLPMDSLDQGARGFWSAFIVLALPGYTAYFVQSMAQGRYPYENFELMLRKNGLKKMKLFDINSYIKFTPSKDHLFTSTGLRVEVFEITCPPEKLDEPYRVILEKYTSLKDISILRDTTVKEGMASENYLSSTIYIVLSFDIAVTNFTSDYKSITENLAQTTRRLSLDETMCLYKKIFNKALDSYAWEIETKGFSSPVALIEKEALAHFGSIDGKAFAVSLASQPEYIGEHYHRALDTLNKVPGTVHINLKPYVPEGNISRQIEQKLIERHHKRKLEADPNDREVHLHLTISAICHGTKEELNQISYELERAVLNAPEMQKPLFIRETTYLRECLLSTIPGKSRLLPTRRRFRVLSANEAMAYLPRMEFRGVENPLFTVRTTKNTYFGLDYSADDPLFIWARMGNGKTSLCCEFVLEHLKQNYRGSRQNSFILTAGDGYDFLLDGLCDLSLYYNNEGLNLAPLDFHPLELLLSFQAKGQEVARNWLCDIMGIDEEALRSQISRLLAELVKEKKFKMSDFYRAFEKYTSTAWPEADIDHFSRKLLSVLYNFCDFEGSLYGSLFEPKTVKNIDFSSIKTVLVTQKKGKDDASAGLIAFYSLATHFNDAWELNIEGPMLYLVDELEHLLNTKAITIKQVEAGSTQGRKNAKYSIMSSQFLSILTKNQIAERFNHFLFASEASAEEMKSLMRLDTSESKRIEGLKSFESAIEEIDFLRPQTYAWGYLDKKKRIHVLIHDINLERLWLISSHAPARDLKKRTMKKFGLNLFQTSKGLALTGFKPPKEDYEYPSEEILETIDLVILKNLNELKEAKL